VRAYRPATSGARPDPNTACGCSGMMPTPAFVPIRVDVSTPVLIARNPLRRRSSSQSPRSACKRLSLPSFAFMEGESLCTLVGDDRAYEPRSRQCFWQWASPVQWKVKHQGRFGHLMAARRYADVCRPSGEEPVAAHGARQPVRPAATRGGRARYEPDGESQLADGDGPAQGRNRPSQLAWDGQRRAVDGPRVRIPQRLGERRTLRSARRSTIASIRTISRWRSRRRTMRR
jgi:hypothetical protein